MSFGRGWKGEKLLSEVFRRMWLIPRGGWACSRFSQVPQGLVAVTLEVPFEPVPLRPLPALGRHPRLFRMPAPPAREDEDFSGLGPVAVP